MDMTDLNRAPAPVARAPEQEMSAEPDHWRDVMSDMSAEIAGPLTAALDRVQVLTTTGRIDRSSLRALGNEIQRARQITSRCGIPRTDQSGYGLSYSRWKTP